MISEPHTDTEREIVILGAGMQGRNVLDIAQFGGASVAGFLDDGKTTGELVNGVPVLGGFETFPKLLDDHVFCVAVGNNRLRLETARQIEASGGHLISVVHPTALVSPWARIGRGVYISSYSRVNANATVADFALIEGLTSVGTDASVGEAAFVGPGVQLIGGATVGAGAFIGAGSVVLGTCTVGESSVVAAGATVITDVPERTLVTGTPATAKGPTSEPPPP